MSDLGSAVTATKIGFFSDASAGFTLGFGAILGKRWIPGDWGLQFIMHRPSIAYLELFALIVGILAWQSETELKDSRVILHYDNISVVHMVNDLTSNCKNCMVLIRLLTINNLLYNRRLTAIYVNTKDNSLSDALSRNQMERFRRLGPQMNHTPDTIPDCLWPVEKILLAD